MFTSRPSRISSCPDMLAVARNNFIMRYRCQTNRQRVWRRNRLSYCGELEEKPEKAERNLGDPNFNLPRLHLFDDTNKTTIAHTCDNSNIIDIQY